MRLEGREKGRGHERHKSEIRNECFEYRPGGGNGRDGLH